MPRVQILFMTSNLINEGYGKLLTGVVPLIHLGKAALAFVVEVPESLQRRINIVSISPHILNVVIQWLILSAIRRHVTRTAISIDIV